MSAGEPVQKRGLTRRAAGATARGTGALLGFFSKLVLVLSVLALGLFVGGFFRFANVVTSYEVPTTIPDTQAVVALTGGSARISSALKLIETDRSKKLLISGVDAHTSLAAIKALNTDRKAIFECCVEVEREALDTVGNAVESAKWMEANSFESLTLVTSDYHMPRSLLEFRRHLPKAKITPYPVKLPKLQNENWYTDTETLRFMVSEYVKYVGALTRDYLTPDTFKRLRASVFGA